MPLELEKDDAHDLFVIRPYGRVTTEDVEAYYANPDGPAQRREGSRILLDTTAIESAAISPSMVRDLAYWPSSEPGRPQRRIAVVVDSAVIAGFASIFQRTRETATDAGTRVFRRLEDAVEWLGLPS